MVPKKHNRLFRKKTTCILRSKTTSFKCRLTLFVISAGGGEVEVKCWFITELELHSYYQLVFDDFDESIHIRGQAFEQNFFTWALSTGEISSTFQNWNVVEMFPEKELTARVLEFLNDIDPSMVRTCGTNW